MSAAEQTQTLLPGDVVLIEATISEVPEKGDPYVCIDISGTEIWVPRAAINAYAMKTAVRAAALEASAIADLIERLRNGVVEVGLHEDSCTELYDVEDANETMVDAAIALAAREAQVSAGEEVIKLLEWEEQGKRNWSAEASFSEYWIEQKKKFWLTSGHAIFAPPWYDTLEDAKTAAQADYERLIRSCLASPPDTALAEARAERDQAIEQRNAELARSNLLASIIRDCPDARTLWGSTIAEETEKELASREMTPIDLAEARAEIEGLRELARPFSDMAGELFARNWNGSAVVIALDNPGDSHRLKASDFFALRAAIRAREPKP
ncbi:MULTISPECIES: hypothetical protein [unclassified Aurantimonas]|uniref:hypothetical protein n=1 Tax=unclassified Aurantimonas TaxID=2638230 RepID=UPI002E1826DB|nr:MULTISPECIES: hypothetical protein [unclassified Aurantimonas]MEC5291561.1 hypothetical protein [Aurantimonas sp. C2-3-R2]MEC5412645.1 hypothetical protein [Aurantimonas sp. C2-4-R8]